MQERLSLHGGTYGPVQELTDSGLSFLLKDLGVKRAGLSGNSKQQPKSHLSWFGVTDAFVSSSGRFMSLLCFPWSPMETASFECNQPTRGVR